MSKGLNANHISLTSSYDIQTICYPLTNFGITYFDFTRRYIDDTASILTNNAEVLNFFLKSKFAISKKEQYQKNQSVFWSADRDITSYDDQLAFGRTIFNLDHGFTIVKVYEKFNDMYAFATTPDNTNVINLYFNNLNLFNQFILYFKDKAKKLLNKQIKNQI